MLNPGFAGHKRSMTLVALEPSQSLKQMFSEEDQRIKDQEMKKKVQEWELKGQIERVADQMSESTIKNN